MRHYTTIKDIAKKLGVSTSTVSRALADRWDINPKTRELVLETARQMNYKPNPMAVMLHKNQTKTIGLIIPEFYNSFFPTVIDGIQNVLQKTGHKLLIMQSKESMETEQANIEFLEDSMVDGIILSVTQEGENVELYERLIERGIPIVFISRASMKVDAPRVMIDNYKMAYQAVEHLLLTGRRNIAYISGPVNLGVTHERTRGYKDALAKYGVEENPSLITPGGMVQEDGYEAAKALLDSSQEIDAIFGFNDHAAIGAMRYLKEAGKRIPDDIAVVGFSESHSALIVEPRLTSVAQPLTEMGERAAEIILDLIDNRKPEKTNVFLEAKLNVRGSSVKEL